MSSKTKRIIAIALALIIPIIFYAIFEWKKHQTGFRVKELPMLSLVAAPDFAFQAHDGSVVNRDSIAGKIVVADYFFTTCPGICKQMTGQMLRVEDFLLKTTKVQSPWQILSFTVDPETDDAATLAEYAQLKGVKSNQWKFLTGSKDSLYALAINFFKLPAIDMGTDSLPEPFVHSERFVLLDKTGFIRGYYDGTDTASVNKMMNDIILLDIHYSIEEGKERKQKKKNQK